MCDFGTENKVNSSPGKKWINKRSCIFFFLFFFSFFMQVARHTRPDGHFKVWATIIFFQRLLQLFLGLKRGYPFYSPYGCRLGYHQFKAWSAEQKALPSQFKILPCCILSFVLCFSCYDIIVIRIEKDATFNHSGADPDKLYPPDSIMTYEDSMEKAGPYLAVVKNG